MRLTLMVLIGLLSTLITPAGNPAQADSNKLLNEEVSVCNLYLGWGHTGSVKEQLKGKKHSGIAMGCNEGDGTMGALKFFKEYTRFQNGSNGTYSNFNFQGTQNSGLNPVIFEREDHPKMKSVFDKNSYVGFMRMNQYNWLRLHQYARDKLLGKKCSKVKLNFYCANDGHDSDYSNDLHDKELSKRMNAWQKPATITDPALSKKYAVELSTLNGVTPLKSCFSIDEEVDSMPMKCQGSKTIDEKTKMAKHCEDWVNAISKLPQHDWDTPPSLPRLPDYSAPSGTLIDQH